MKKYILSILSFCAAVAAFTLQTRELHNTQKELTLANTLNNTILCSNDLLKDSMSLQLVLKDELLDSMSLELGRCVNKPRQVITKTLVERYTDPKTLIALNEATYELYSLRILNDSLELDLVELENELYRVDFSLDSVSHILNSNRTHNYTDNFNSQSVCVKNDTLDLDITVADLFDITVVRDPKVFRKDKYTVSVSNSNGQTSVLHTVTDKNSLSSRVKYLYESKRTIPLTAPNQ